MQLITLLVLLISTSSQTSRRRCTSKFAVRLNERMHCSFAGYLEVCWSSNDGEPLQWHRVCGGKFSVENNVAALVVCRQLGFNSKTGI